MMTMISRTLFVVVLLSAIQASRQQESLGELRIVEPLPNQVITEKTYLKWSGYWMNDSDSIIMSLRGNLYVFKSRAPCQVISLRSKNVTHCVTCCDSLENVRSRCNVDDAEYEQSGNLRCDHS